ncbi:MAG: Wzz/FepE/Etk N-terminal domain-containing protein [Bacillota bacterium]
MKLLQVLKTYKKTIVAAILVSLLSGLLLSTCAVPRLYRATAVLMVAGAEDPATGKVSYLDVLANKQLVKTYCEIIPSKDVMNRVSQELHFTVSAEELRRAVRVRQKGDTVLIEISVYFPNSRQAASIANKTAEVFIEKEKTTLRMANVRLIDAASENRIPVSPNIPLYMVGAVLIGFILTFSGCLMVGCARRSPDIGNTPGKDDADGI